MKFHCDRCKTKYSIADERVRGKILKIRCKNCSAVITVRESMGSGAAQAPAVPERARRAPTGGSGRARRPSSTGSGRSSALQGAFQQVIARPPEHAEPSASDSFAAPATLEEEWYVSIDGDQSGPFNLQQARDWVAERHVDDELFCWSEGFDDWLPTEKVSHFRGLRSRPDTAPARAPSVSSPALAPAPRIPPSEKTPKPLFAAALAALEKETTDDLPDALAPPPMASGAGASPRLPTASGAPPIPSPALPRTNGSNASPLENAFAQLGDQTGESEPAPGSSAVDDALEDMDLDIGEVSRVVKLPQIAAMRHAGGAAAMEPAGLPGMGGALGRGTGSAAALRQTGGAQALAPLSDAAIADAQPPVLASEKKKNDKALLYIIGGVAGLAVIGLVIFMLATSGGGERRVSNADYGDDSLEQLGYRFENPNLGADPDRSADDDDDDDDDDNKASTGGSSSRRDNTQPSRGNTTTNKDTTSKTNTNAGGRVEVVPGNDDPELTPLSPIDVTRVASNMTTGRRCYERALKKDPFLSVSKIYVTLTVNTDGVVTSVSLSKMSGDFLGQCLIAGVRKWKFRKSSKGITTQISLVFEQR